MGRRVNLIFLYPLYPASRISRALYPDGPDYYGGTAHLTIMDGQCICLSPSLAPSLSCYTDAGPEPLLNAMGPDGVTLIPSPVPNDPHLFN